jgi:hypothetical protein
MCNLERDGAQRERMRASCVRMDDALGMAGDGGARGCGVPLTREATACVGKGLGRASD